MKSAPAASCVGAIERVAAAAAALGVEAASARRQERIEIAVDGPHRDPEALGELFGRDAGAPRPQVLGEREQSSGPLQAPRGSHDSGFN